MKRLLCALALSGCASAPTMVCKRGGEVVYHGPAPDGAVTDDGLLFRVRGRTVWIEADRCWRVR